MDLGLVGKTALVTGASSGIGAAVGQVLAEEGVDVILAYHRNTQGVLKTAEVVGSLGRRAIPLQMDISDPEGIKAALAGIEPVFDALDLLILCAGYNQVTPFEALTPQEWNQVMAVNLDGVFYLVQAAVPWMQDGGSIVTVASVAAHTGAPHHMHYAAAKAGLVNLTKSLARQLGPGIRVNCVAPGITQTPMGEATLDALPPDYAQKKLLTGRFATQDEIARTIVFVASPVAGFMTGATVDINGGRDLR